MKYRVTCLTPTLVGDGQRLSPIDYMVWKDHVNVLDQNRIFKLLAKGPRLDGYLTQLKKADRLDFASWGGFAQNFAGRRIPFEHASSIPAWERAQPHQLFIPTFTANHVGPYLPATALKGALRTGTVFDRWSDKTLAQVAQRMAEDRIPRNPAGKAEDSVLGGNQNILKQIGAGDSAHTTFAGLRVHMLRVSTLVPRGSGKFELAWKSQRGHGRIDDSTPLFAEMAIPGTVFQGSWKESGSNQREKVFAAANRYAASQLERHKEYAVAAGLSRFASGIDQLGGRLKELSGTACLLCLGWGGGLLSKVAVGDTSAESYSQIVRQFPYYRGAVQTGLPFPKTRRIVFEKGEAAQVPGWVLLEVI